MFYTRISQRVGHGPLAGHGRIFDRPRPCIIEIEYVLQDEPLTQGFSTRAASELTGLAFSNALIVAHVAL